MKKTYTEVPSWATSMVSNFRTAAKISADIDDVVLFNAIEQNDICAFNTEDQVDALRGALDLEPLEDVN